MQRLSARLAIASLLLMALEGRAYADSLQVEPVLLNVVAPAAASAITLRNPSQTAINVQLRVFRWAQGDRGETLEPTDDVVASPPAVTLKPNGEYVVRVVRVTKSPVTEEESYRLLVDQLPDLTRHSNRAVNFLMRQSLPVFFAAAETTPAEVSWMVSTRDGTLVLSARNEGDTRLRISAVTLRNDSGRKRSVSDGLLGYVLGHSTMQWRLPGTSGLAARDSVTISAQSDQGPIQEVVVLRAGD